MHTPIHSKRSFWNLQIIESDSGIRTIDGTASRLGPTCPTAADADSCARIDRVLHSDRLRSSTQIDRKKYGFHTRLVFEFHPILE